MLAVAPTEMIPVRPGFLRVAYGAQGLGPRVWGLGLKALGLGFRVSWHKPACALDSARFANQTRQVPVACKTTNSEVRQAGTSFLLLQWRKARPGHAR